MILDEFCKGCALCVEFCPEGKLVVAPTPDKRGIQIATVDAEAVCTGCLQCTTICPDAAVQVTRLGGAGEDRISGAKAPRARGARRPAEA